MGLFLFFFRYLRLLDVDNFSRCSVQHKTVYCSYQHRSVCVLPVSDYHRISIPAAFLFGELYPLCFCRRNGGVKYRRLAMVQYFPSYFCVVLGFILRGARKNTHFGKLLLFVPLAFLAVETLYLLNFVFAYQTKLFSTLTNIACIGVYCFIIKRFLAMKQNND